MSMQATQQQQKVFEWVEQSEGNLFLEANAGTGKSSTLRMVAARLDRMPQWKREPKVYLAFGKGNVKDNAERLKKEGSSVECRTIHSLGRGAVWKALKDMGKTMQEKANGKKYTQIAQEYWSYQSINEKVYKRGELKSQLKKLVDFARLTLMRIPWQDEPRYTVHIKTDPYRVEVEYPERRSEGPLTEEEILRRLVRHYNLDIDANDPYLWELMWHGVRWCIEKGAQQLLQEGKYDHTDTIFLPVYFDWTPKKYKFLMIDEAQDLNACQLELVRMAQKQGARYLFCGDKRQSIMGFAGADTESVDNIIRIFHCAVLPLSVCFRCPTSHLDLARQLVPTIENAPHAREGLVKVIHDDQFIEVIRRAKEQSERELYIVGRMTTPLVGRCLNLIHAGIKAIMIGRNIGSSIIDLIKKLTEMSHFHFEQLSEHIEEYRSEQLRILDTIEDNETLISDLQDKADTALTLLHGYQEEAITRKQEPHFDGFLRYINNFFSETEDEEGNTIKRADSIHLCTAHRAKGLEAEVVFIDGPENFPHPASKRGWQREQEYNLLYVALTRAKEELYFIDGVPSDIHLPETEKQEETLEEQQPCECDQDDDSFEFGQDDGSTEVWVRDQQLAEGPQTRNTPMKEIATSIQFSLEKDAIETIEEILQITGEDRNLFLLRHLIADPQFATIFNRKKQTRLARRAEELMNF